jgi:hypothetical protein
VSFLADKLLLPPFHHLQLPHLFCDGGHCESQNSHIVLGRQANLKESSESKELAELRLQVLVVVISSDACESKKEIMRLRE